MWIVGPRGGLSWATVENPWLDNKLNVSCIPEGTYICKRVDSPAHGNTFRVMNVVNRKYINFHIGNTADSVEGCIAVAEKMSTSALGIVNSRDGFTRFLTSLRDYDEFILTIRQYSVC